MAQSFSRRAFIRRIGISSGALFLTHCKSISTLAPARESDGPINHLVPDPAPRAFFGPDPMRVHPILWNTAGQPTPATWSQHAGPVIIGGGISGLTAAFTLRDRNPLVLESDLRFGGNSQGQEWQKIPYAIGAAYIVSPDDDSPIDQLLHDLDLKRLMKISRSEDEYAQEGVVRHGLWHGGQTLYGAEAPKVERLRELISRVLEDDPTDRYPDMPTDDQELRRYIDTLDQESFQGFLERRAGGALPEPLATALEQYCWSSLGGSAAEISAASAMNFYASEFADIGVFSGGNGRITQTLFEQLISRNGRGSLRSGTTVSRVERTANGVRIVAHSPTGEVYGIEAPVVIVCCPKFVAKRIVVGLPAEQLAAFSRLRYRSYLTANLLINEDIKKPFYDMYLLKQDNGKAFAPRAPLDAIGATDAILANWYTGDTAQSVITLYRALPYDGARAEIYDPSSYERIRAGFEKQIATELLPLFGISQKNVVDIRITRWGHALPLAEKGLIAARLPELLRQPIEDRIFFAQQDNWALPAFETAALEAIEMANRARAVLT